MQDVISRSVLVRCGDRLPVVDSAYLDCVSDTLALLLAERGVADVRAPFAADWRFDLSRGADGRLGPALPPAGQDELLAQRTGWRPRWQPAAEAGADARAWHARLSAGTPLAVVADAFHLPWLPYHGHEHMEHGFVVEAVDAGDDPVVTVVDPYDNVTQWGPAVPTQTAIALSDLAPALPGGRWGFLEPAGAAHPRRPGEVVLDNAQAIAEAARDGRYERFIDQYRALTEADLTHLALQTWLLRRSRGLHRLWLAGLRPGTVAAATAQLFAGVEAAWQRAGESAYVALRRVSRGRTAPPAALETLRAAADAELAAATTLLERESER
ncbi:hypothetical protein [Actinoplanes sp. NPDC020271]|uniref:hypothetical protein n=1 Tax=Actinoplanes sp. NPDC020271 TaxID=3363896 RepID=UPI003791BEE1